MKKNVLDCKLGSLGMCGSFSTMETAPMGRYLGGPVTWGGFDDERVEALNLDWEVCWN